jgi:hypothetical protein
VNLANPPAPHRRGATLVLTDAGHHEQIWTTSQGGKEQSEVFEFTRKGAAR